MDNFLTENQFEKFYNLVKKSSDLWSKNHKDKIKRLYLLLKGNKISTKNYAKDELYYLILDSPFVNQFISTQKKELFTSNKKISEIFQQASTSLSQLIHLFIVWSELILNVVIYHAKLREDDELLQIFEALPFEFNNQWEEINIPKGVPPIDFFPLLLNFLSLTQSVSHKQKQKIIDLLKTLIKIYFYLLAHPDNLSMQEKELVRLFKFNEFHDKNLQELSNSEDTYSDNLSMQEKELVRLFRINKLYEKVQKEE